MVRIVQSPNGRASRKIRKVRPLGNIYRVKSDRSGRVTFKVKIDLPSSGPGLRRTFTRTFKSREEAEAELSCRRQEAKRGIALNDTQSLREWVREWLDLHMDRRVGRRTWEGYDQKLRLHVLPALGDKQLRRLTVGDIEDLYRELAESGGRFGKGLHKTSITHVHRVLSQCLEDAARRHRIAANPAAAVKRGKNAAKGRKKPKMAILTPDQLGSLLKGLQASQKGIDGVLYPLVTLALDSGARRGELLALRWADCDLERQTVSIERAVDQTKAYGIRLRDWPKTEDSIRTVSISASTAALLRQERVRQAEEQLKLGRKLPADALVFPISARAPTEPMRPDDVSKAFRRVAKRLGTPMRFHDLRHNCASHMLRKGRTIPEVADQLGHGSLDMVLRCYGHFVPDGSQRKGLLDELGM